jgi:alpha-N-arabinofuranosidase
MIFLLSLFMATVQPATAQTVAQRATTLRAPAQTQSTGTGPAARYYHNPILAGFYPDPSICRVGKDYYLVNSSFAYFPALPIFHSRDLVNWRQIGNAMDRPEQLDLTGVGVSRGLFAPAIRFYNGLYYITCTFVDKLGNFVITARNPRGPWTKPVALPAVNGIDPSLFFDDNGKAYIIYNSIPPDNKSLYEGHRTIRMRAFDPARLQTIGEESILVNGGSALEKKPVWIEGPHLFKKDGYYYLIAAEGGTDTNHSEVVFRSATLTGPFLPGGTNPILTQRQLDPGRPSPVTSTGHADFVSTPTGSWYAVFLGCRPYAADFYNTGRETFMAPVKWTSDWPVIIPPGAVVQDRYPVPFPANSNAVVNAFNGRIPYRADFNESTLDPSLLFLRTPRQKWYSLSERKGYLSLRLLPQTCAGTENPAFVGHRQQQPEGYAATALIFDPRQENEKAGLLVFQNETHFYFLARSFANNLPVIQLFRSSIPPSPGNTAPTSPTDEASSTNGQMELIASRTLDTAFAGQPLQLKIEARGSTYAFYYAEKKKDWILLKEKVDAKFLSTRAAGGFVGCLYALYATATGQPSEARALFDWFGCGPL